jgi:hypothetical protein
MIKTNKSVFCLLLESERKEKKFKKKEDVVKEKIRCLYSNFIQMVVSNVAVKFPLQGQNIDGFKKKQVDKSKLGTIEN